jgi:NitT/TauT family transport system substrate-binding protein
MRIRLAENFRALFYAPFYATQVLGFYADEGIVVDLFNSPAPAAAAAGLLDGSIDISWGGPMRVLKARDLDPASPLVCFCEVVARDPFFLVGKGRRSGFDLADLARLKVATVSEVPTPWLCLQHDLRERGVNPGRIYRVADRTMGDNLTALRKGEVDVVQMFEPYVSMALQAGAGDILYAASNRGPTVYTTFLTTRDNISRNRVAFAAMVRATRRTLAGSHAILPGRATRSPYDFASTLPRRGPVGANAGGITSRVWSPGRKPQVWRIYFPNA